VTVKHKGKVVYLEQMPMRGYLSTVDPRPNLGLGPLTVVDSLIVEWPDDRITLLTNVKTDQILNLYQKDGVKMSAHLPDPVVSENACFKDICGENRMDFIHVEDDFNDFEVDKILYHMMSTEGPGMCKGDINGDRLDDIYAGGAKGQPGSLMVQLENGSFVRLKNLYLKKTGSLRMLIVQCLMQTATRY
jgi:hypothetical protein